VARPWLKSSTEHGASLAKFVGEMLSSRSKVPRRTVGRGKSFSHSTPVLSAKVNSQRPQVKSTFGNLFQVSGVFPLEAGQYIILHI